MMVYWEAAYTEADQPPFVLDYATVWQAADKVVYSTTLESVTSARTRIERTFDPQAVRAMKDAADRDLSVGGPALAAHAFREGLVDEVRVFVSPVVVGGGKQFLPDKVRLDLELTEEHRFRNGVVFLQYRVAT